MYNIKSDFKEKNDFCKSFIDEYNKRDLKLTNFISLYRIFSDIKELSFYKIIEIKKSVNFGDKKTTASLVDYKEFEKILKNKEERNEIFIDLFVFINTFMEYINSHKIINEELVHSVISFTTKVINNLIVVDRKDILSSLNKKLYKYRNFLIISLEIFEKEDVEIFSNNIIKLFSLNYRKNDYWSDFLILPIQNECLKKSLGLSYEKDIKKIFSIKFNYQIYAERFSAITANMPTMFRTIASGINYLYDEEILNPIAYYGYDSSFTLIRKASNKNDLKMLSFLIGKYCFNAFENIINDELIPDDYILTNDIFEEYKKNILRFTFLYIYYFNKYNCYMFNECITHYTIENGVIWPYTIKEFLYENMFNENVDDLLKDYLDEKEISKLKEILLSIKIDMDI